MRRSTRKILWLAAAREVSGRSAADAEAYAQLLLSVKREPQTKRVGEFILRLLAQRSRA